ncbi:micrococcal nuclease, partial [Escherichia coli]|nr:micrococcal nuclease [Escherichia coli]
SLPALQREAQEQKRGLWADSNPVPPWEWRHKQN